MQLLTDAHLERITVIPYIWVAFSPSKWDVDRFCPQTSMRAKLWRSKIKHTDSLLFTEGWMDGGMEGGVEGCAQPGCQ